MKYLYYLCFFFYTIHGQRVDEFLSPSPPQTAFGDTTFTSKKNKAMAVVGAYCKTTPSPKEAEELLDFGEYSTLFVRTK